MAEDKRLAGKVPEEGEETPPDFDPMLDQGMRLPASIRGSDEARSHVTSVDSDGDVVESLPEEDEEFGFEPRDPGSFTADS